MAHAALGKAFPDLPVVLTTSSETGLSTPDFSAFPPLTSV